jgi:hypothetical protein
MFVVNIIITTMKAQTKSVGFVNQVNISIIENGQQLVPIKPICEALGIDSKNQRSRIQEDEILNSVGVLSTSTGSDGKQYEMFCLPARYIFGWLFSINPANVKPEAKEAVIQYKKLCYDILYDAINGHFQFMENQLKESAMRKARIDKLKVQLLADERFQEFERLKLEEQQASYSRRQQVTQQLSLFKQQYSQED